MNGKERMRALAAEYANIVMDSMHRFYKLPKPVREALESDFENWDELSPAYKAHFTRGTYDEFAHPAAALRKVGWTIEPPKKRQRRKAAKQK